MLRFDPNWHYNSPGKIENGVSSDILDLICRMAKQGNEKAVLELFKGYFADAVGNPRGYSSSASWAQADLITNMDAAAENAPLFINAFYSGCIQVSEVYPEIAPPKDSHINRVIVQSGYQIDDGRLISTNTSSPIPVPSQAPTLDDQARALIQGALDASEDALANGNGRQAVQDVLWLLETVSTAFNHPDVLNGGIKGKYFNNIVNSLKKQKEGPEKNILEWMIKLHGFLSSPTGGGIRHGTDITISRSIHINEARLYCNLIRSYTTFLIEEYQRLRQ
jgi:hypothetical protein